MITTKKDNETIRYFAYIDIACVQITQHQRGASSSEVVTTDQVFCPLILSSFSALITEIMFAYAENVTHNFRII